MSATLLAASGRVTPHSDLVAQGKIRLKPATTQSRSPAQRRPLPACAPSLARRARRSAMVRHPGP
jgi:hypothetical protein